MASRSLRLVEYVPEHKEAWDELVTSSRNGTFLFYRDYMDYHADRFTDRSLMFLAGNDKPLAVLPANVAGDDLISHQGLTFGGMVCGSKMTTVPMLDAFDLIREYLDKCGLKRLIYKAVPHIYHASPAEEDLYALFYNDARLVRRDVSVAVQPEARCRFQERRRRAIKKAANNGIEVRISTDFRRYMELLESVLHDRHGTSPVHTADEIELLASRFPQHIKLFASYGGEDMLAGVIVYETSCVAHCQYIAGLPESRAFGALDGVFAFLIEDYYSDKKYFDFGISNEQEGRFLNEGLIEYKEGFGARAVAYDFYCLHSSLASPTGST